MSFIFEYILLIINNIKIQRYIRELSYIIIPALKYIFPDFALFIFYSATFISCKQQ